MYSCLAEFAQGGNPGSLEDALERYETSRRFVDSYWVLHSRLLGLFRQNMLESPLGIFLGLNSSFKFSDLASEDFQKFYQLMKFPFEAYGDKPGIHTFTTTPRGVCNALHAAAGSSLSPAECCREGEVTSLEIQALNHASLTTTDVATLSAFYSNVLGFRYITRPSFDFEGAWLEHPSSHFALHIIKNETSSCNTADGDPMHIRRSQHFAFDVKSLSNAEGMLQNLSISYAKAQVPNSDIAQLFLYDPDGNGIELLGRVR